MKMSKYENETIILTNEEDSYDCVYAFNLFPRGVYTLSG